MRKAACWLYLLVLITAPAVHASTTWDAEDYDLYSADFDGDGVADILYVAKAPGNLSGIARGVSGGFDTSFQSWTSNYLGINWAGNQYNVIVLRNRATSNKKADILLQSKSSGGTSYLLKPDVNGRMQAVFAPITTNGGLTWSADQYTLVAGDFNGDGMADILLQSTSSARNSAIMLADGTGQFSSSTPAQSWPDGYLGFNWATNEAVLSTGDFNGDGYADVLVQARPRWVEINYDIPFPVPTYPPNLNGVSFGHATGSILSSASVPGQALGYAQWSRNAFGIDWSPLSANVLVGNFGASTYSDLLLQGLHPGQNSYLLTGTGTSAIFGAAATLASNVMWTADSAKLIAGNFGGGTRTGVYFQAPTGAGTNAFTTNVTGSTVTTVAQDPSAPPPGAFPTVAGHTTTSFSVAANGAATYSIPITLPPALGALDLKLALAYSSSGADGTMGMGWSLKGMSAISRCAKTFAQDGAGSAVLLQATDRLCLNGSQLKLTGGTYGAAGATYATEIESFSRIQAGATLVGNEAASFTVTTKDGLIYSYGGTADSEIMAGNSGQIRMWALSKIADRDGNAISLVYQNDTQGGDPTSGSYRIDHINYPTTTSGLGPYYTVQFNYSARPTNAVPAAYVAGYLVQEANKLNNISILRYGTSTVIKQYNLAYTPSTTTNRLTLTAVQECSASTCLPSTAVGYQAGATGWPNAQSGTLPVQFPGIADTALFADMDGDGRPDIVEVATTGNCANACPVYVQFNTGTGWGPQTATGYQVNILGLKFAGHLLGNQQQQVVVTPAGAGAAPAALSYNATSKTFSLISLSVLGSAIPLAAADIDGDGLDDIIAGANLSGCPNGVCLYTTLMVARNTTSPPGAASFAAPVTVWTAPTGDGVTVGTFGIGQGGITASDFNGDGRADFLVTTSDGNPSDVWATPLISNGAPGGAPAAFTAGPTWLLWGGGGGLRSQAPLDWNGDGCTDVLIPNGVTTATVEISNCAGGFNALALTIPVNQTPAQPTGWIPIDWDGDGKSDILYVASDQTLHVLRSVGVGVGQDSATSVSVSATGIPAPMDINGDGLQDLVFGGFSTITGTYTPYYSLHNAAATPPDLATSFTDGLGMYQQPSYAPLTNNTYYTKYNTATFPEADIQQPIYVTSGFTATDGTGSTYSNSFMYFGARTQLEGRGFEGFAMHRRFDSRNGLYTVSTQYQTFPLTGLAQTTYDTQDLTHVVGKTSTTSLQSVTLPTSGGGFQTRYLPLTNTKTSSTYESGGTKNYSLISSANTTFSNYDSYGNAQTVTTTTTDNDSVAPASPFNGLSWTTTVAQTFDNDVTDWCYGLPVTKGVTTSVPGQTTQTRNSSYVVDGPHCRVSQKTEQPGSTTLQVVTSYNYAPSGCTGDLTSVSVVGQNPNGTAMAVRTTLYDYAIKSGRCQLPEKITDALGFATQIAYNYDFGTKTTSTDANNLVTSWSLDDYGRVTQESRPDGTSTKTGYIRCELAPCWGQPDLRFLVRDDEYGSDSVNFTTRERYYDGFGRQRYDDSYRVLGVWTQKAVTYDALGRKSIAYQPWSSASNGYTQWHYDLLNRPTSQALYTGAGVLDRTTMLQYLGQTFSVTDPLNNTIRRVTDVTGRLRQVIDPSPGGTTQYNYDVFGNLDQTIDAIGISSSATYNLRGCRTQMVDADGGTWNYQCDSLDELVSWSDAKGQSFTQGFDAIARRVSQTNSTAGTYSWTYGTSAAAFNVGKLASETGNGYTVALTYDSASRVKNRSITLSTAQNFQYDYTYNAIGEIATTTYPTSPIPTGQTGARFKVQTLYSYGVPFQIQDVTNGGATTIWSLGSANDYSSPVTETLGSGNGLTSITSGYQGWTDHLTSVQSGTGTSATNMQNLSYVWDTDDNLSQRQDLIQGLLEHFNPDPLNRLSTSTLNSVQNLSVTYDAAGDILTRSDVGGYTYGNAIHPHGVTAFGSGGSYAYDANGNVTTRNGSSIIYDAYNYPITMGAVVGGTGLTTNITYGPDHQRQRQVAQYLNGTETTLYAGSLLEEMTASSTNITYWRHYVMTPSGKTIVLSRNSDASTTTNLMLSDSLGSSDAIVNGGTGALNVQESFGAFGLRRQSNWQPGVPSYWNQLGISEATRHGFTGQEHLDDVGLIHMNGRVYDPTTGRFLSADPVMGDLIDSQRLNPYSYVNNRPLIDTDPTGFDGLDEEIGLGEVLVIPQGYLGNPPGFNDPGAEFECFQNCSTTINLFAGAMVSEQQLDGNSVQTSAGTDQDSGVAATTLTTGAQSETATSAAAAAAEEGTSATFAEVIVAALRYVAPYAAVLIPLNGGPEHGDELYLGKNQLTAAQIANMYKPLQNAGTTGSGSGTATSGDASSASATPPDDQNDNNNSDDKKKNVENERRSAVAKAWRQEQRLVRATGQGTRQWTDKEIDELLKEGKVDGYQGHHINSVNGNPEMAGNPDNIEFVRGGSDHLALHDGNFRNPTSGPLLDRSIP